MLPGERGKETNLKPADKLTRWLSCKFSFAVPTCTTISDLPNLISLSFFLSPFWLPFTMMTTMILPVLQCFVIGGRVGLDKGRVSIRSEVGTRTCASR